MENQTDIETIQAGILRIIGKSGNTTNAYMKNGKAALDIISSALDKYHTFDNAPGILRMVGMDERMNEVPFTVVLDDVIFVMLFPPPSGLAIVQPGMVSGGRKVPS